MLNGWLAFHSCYHPLPSRHHRRPPLAKPRRAASAEKNCKIAASYNGDDACCDLFSGEMLKLRTL